MYKLHLLFIVGAAFLVSSCAMQISREKQPSDPALSEFTLTVPDVLDDEWTRWIVGEWGDFCEPGSQKKRSGTMKAELGLNGQFLIIQHENEITEEDVESLKEGMQANEDQAAKFQNQTHKEIEYYTIDPQTGEVVAYLFDSLRCIAVGRGSRQGDKEVIEWKWMKGGQQVTTSIRTTERVGKDKLMMTDKYIAPDGKVLMEGKAEAVRKK